MKVQGPNRPIPIDSARRRAAGKGAAAKPSQRRGEQVRVSAEARALMDARGPEAPDQARVARLKEAILNGTFRIDAERIAEAMLREEV